MDDGIARAKHLMESWLRQTASAEDDCKPCRFAGLGAYLPVNAGGF
jgi:hypothetical protein